MAKPPITPNSILVYVGSDRFGDGLLKLPFVRCLRTLYPDARITWLAGRMESAYLTSLASLIDGLIDEVIAYGGVGKSYRELLKQPMNGQRFDLIIDTQKSFLIALALWRIPHKALISPFAKFLLSSRRPPRGYRFPRTMLRQMLDLLEIASGKTVPTPDALVIPAPPEMVRLAEQALPDGPTYVGLSPGAGQTYKCWPLKKFVALAKDLAAKGRVPVFILGPMEKDWQGELAAAVPSALFPLQSGMLGDDPYGAIVDAAVAARLGVAVANDSGLGHILSAGDVPMISLFGATSSKKFPPLCKDLTVLDASDFGDRDVSAIPLEAVIIAVDEALS